MPLARYGAVAAVVVPALVLAGVGLTHPHRLTEGTAGQWRALHIALLPVFPLLAVGPWLVTRPAGRWVGALAVVLGYVYAVCYTALDVLAGIGGGALVLGGAGESRGLLYREGNDLAVIGVWAYLAAAVIAAAVALRRHRLLALPGAVLVVLGAYLFLDSHIYWPVGVMAMLALGMGWGYLVWFAWPGSEPAEQHAERRVRGRR